MKQYKFAVILLMILALLVGCSKKQEEAAKLEQELLGQNGQDSLVDSTAAEQVIDTTILLEPEPEAETSEYAMPKQPAGEGFTVQVAGCPDEAYANFLVGLYTGRGYEPFVTIATVEGQTFYRVRIGVFSRYVEATKIQGLGHREKRNG